MASGRKWAFSLASVMFLTTTIVQCQNTTSANNVTNINITPTSDEIIPGTLKIDSDNLFEAPNLFGGQPFSIKTDPVTGQVDFQTKTVNVQAVNEARDKEEAKKAAALHDDLRTRVPSSADLPLEARDEEYADLWGEPIKRADVEYYDEEPLEMREPIMTPNRDTKISTTTPKEEDSFMSIFESLFGGGEEEKKEEITEPPKKYNAPYRDRFNAPSTVNPDIRSTIRPFEPHLTTRRPDFAPVRSTTENRRVYDQFPEKQSPQLFNTENQYEPPSRDRYNSYQQGRPTGRPTNYHQQPPMFNDRLNLQQQSFNVQQQPLQSPPLRPPMNPAQDFYPVTPERPYSSPKPSENPNMSYYSEKSTSPSTTSTTTTTTTTSTARPPQTTENDWQTNNLSPGYKKENIDRQDTVQNEIKNTQHTPDYYNFINLPVHYSTKDTAIPLISGSYANTKIQGMGANKYEKNSGKYSNHKYDQTTTSKRPNYWSTKRPTTVKPTPTATIVDFGSLENDDGAIGFSADFGGYGQKAGVSPVSEKTTTRTTPPRTTTTTSTTTTNKPSPTTTTIKSTTTTRFTPSRTTSTQPIPVREYDDYDYEGYPAQVKPMQNPMQSARPFETTRPASTTSSTTTTTRRVPPPPKEPEYEYYDYEAETTTPTTTSTSTSTTTTTTTARTTTAMSSKYKLRYPSLSKDKIRRPDEKVEVVVPVQTEATTQKQYTEKVQRPGKPQNEPAPVFEDSEQTPSKTAQQNVNKNSENVKPIIINAEKNENNANIVLVPAKETSSSTSKRPEGLTNRQPPPHPDYTTEFTVGAVHGHGSHPTHQGGFHQSQGHFVASSIAASPFEGPDEPFRPIPRPAGMSASFQVSGDTPAEEHQPHQHMPQYFQPPQEPDIHEPHEFIPSPQFHRPENDRFVVGTTFNTKPQSKPNKQYIKQDFSQQPPRKNEIIKPRPQRPGAVYPPTSEVENEFFTTEQKPGNIKPNIPQTNVPQSPTIPPRESDYYKPTIQPNYYPASNPEEELYDPFEPNQLNDNKKGQSANVELSVDYDFDGIQTEPKPGQYVIFSKPQINSEINENQLKKVAGFPQFQNKETTETVKLPEVSTTDSPALPPQPEKPEVEKQQEMASNYPRPHWEKNGKPSFLVGQNNRSPYPPPHMSSNLIPPGNIPPRFRRPVSPPNIPPVRKNYNEGSYQPKPKPNLPNILPQFRPNAKIGNGQRPYRLPPNRRKESFPYRIQTEPDALMHRDFEIEEEIVPKFITNRGKIQDYEPTMQKRFGAPPSPPPRRHQRTPVTTLQMLQQTHGMKKQHMPSTREDHPDPTLPLVPPMYKPFKDEDKEVYLVYPMKTPFNSNIKIEDPDKIDYTFNQTYDQVPLLKPSKKKEKPKPDFPYGFVTPEENPDVLKKEPMQQQSTQYLSKAPKGSEEVEPNIQDYMPSGAKMPHHHRERIDMNLHMQSNNQWNQVSTQGEPAVITKKDDTAVKINPPTQYHTILKNTNASEFTLGAVMHTLTDQSKKETESPISINEDTSSLVRPGLNVNERISNGKIVTVSMPLDIKEESEETSAFQAPFQASTAVQGPQGWNIVEQTENAENSTQNANATTFDFENFKPELIGGFKPIYSSPEEEENPGIRQHR